MSESLLDGIRLLPVYVLLGLSCVGWGRLVQAISGRSAVSCWQFALLPWAGWAAILLVLQCVHFFLPLDAWPVVCVLLGGAVPGLKFLREHPQAARPGLAGVVCAVALSALAIWLGARSQAAPSVFDAGLYYLQTMRWLNEYAIVPGLGNLHGRLAFNQSALVWAAALNFYPLGGGGRSFANVFLVLLSFLSAGLFLKNAVHQNGDGHHARCIPAIALLFLSPALFMPVLIRQWTTAPMPDVAVMLLQFAIFAGFLVELGAWARGEAGERPLLATIAFLAASAITVKLSTAVFSMCIICFCIFRAWRAGGREAVLQMLFLPFCVIAIWVCRSYILSGVPVYPLAVARLPFEWSVPVERLQEEARWISGWAREPGVHWSQVPADGAWIAPWFTRVRDNPLVVQPLCGALALVFSSAVLALTRRSSMPGHPRVWACLAPPIASMAFWFLTAPDPRFTLGAVWCLFAAVAAVFYLEARAHQWGKGLLFVLPLVFLVSNAAFLQPLLDGRGSGSEGAVASIGVQQSLLRARVTDSGLVVSIAEKDGRCWDAPLPCAPHFDAGLALRQEGSLGAGFVSKGGTP